MKRFGYLRDPLFLTCCALYALNRYFIKTHVHLAFFHNWFNDILLIPCALPPLLFVHDRLGIRSRGSNPTLGEILGHLAGWSFLFEVIGPHIMRTTGDVWDVVAYTGGAIVSFAWWNRPAVQNPVRQAANFDFLAPHYRWMEWLLAGNKLHRCRTAFLPLEKAPRSVLLLGEGHGRSLTELLRLYPDAHYLCLDSSVKMLKSARKNLTRHGLTSAKVHFEQVDVLDWNPPANQFDLVVTNFFLDCFRKDQLEKLLPKISNAATFDAVWLVADFRLPDAGWRRWRADAILRSMYLFFHILTRLPARQLPAVDSLLAGHSFELRQRKLFDWGLLQSDCWQRSL